MKKKVRPQKKRAYDNTTRAKQSEENQNLIIQTLVALLVQRRGEEVNIAEVAKAAKMSERTVFRFFKDKQALHEATGAYLAGFLSTSASKLDDLDVASFAKYTYESYDRNEDMTIAYLRSPFGQETRKQLRKKLNEQLIAKLESEKPGFGNSKAEKARRAVILYMINPKLWDDIRTDLGFSGAEIGEAYSWAIQTLLKKG